MTLAPFSMANATLSRLIPPSTSRSVDSPLKSVGDAYIDRDITDDQMRRALEGVIR